MCERAQRRAAKFAIPRVQTSFDLRGQRGHPLGREVDQGPVDRVLDPVHLRGRGGALKTNRVSKAVGTINKATRQRKWLGRSSADELPSHQLTLSHRECRRVDSQRLSEVLQCRKARSRLPEDLLRTQLCLRRLKCIAQLTQIRAQGRAPAENGEGIADKWVKGLDGVAERCSNPQQFCAPCSPLGITCGRGLAS